jgi:hypothetical protein
MVTKKRGETISFTHPLIYHITYAAFNLYSILPPHPSPLPPGEREGVRGKFQIFLVGILFESRKSNSLELTAFDPNENHILFA